MSASDVQRHAREDGRVQRYSEREDVHGNNEEEQHAPLTARQKASLRFLQVNTPISLLCCIATALFAAMIVPSIHYVFRSQPTYFSMAPLMLLAYSIVMLLFEFGFCLLAVITPNPHTQRCIVQGAGSRLALANYMLSMWLLCRIIDSTTTMVIGSCVLVGIAILTLTNGVVLRAKYRARWMHPLELLLVHVPNKLVFLFVAQVLLWDQLMLTWGWDRSLGRDALANGFWFAVCVQTLFGIGLIVWITYTCDVSVYVISMFLDAAVLKFYKMPIIGPNARPFVLTIIFFVSMFLRTIALLVPAMLQNGFLVICHTHRRHVPDAPYENPAVEDVSTSTPSALPPPSSAQPPVGAGASNDNDEESTERTRLLRHTDPAYGAVSSA